MKEKKDLEVLLEEVKQGLEKDNVPEEYWDDILAFAAFENEYETIPLNIELKESVESSITYEDWYNYAMSDGTLSEEDAKDFASYMMSR